MHHAWMTVGALLLGAACGTEEELELEPPEVGVFEVQKMRLNSTQTLAGTLNAFNAVDLTARIEGRVEARNFREGEIVEKGRLLYLLEQDRYVAEVAQQQANLHKAEADLAASKREYARFKGLLEEGATTEQIVDNLSDQVAVAESKLEAAKASLAAAQVDLDNTRIVAPITGSIGQAFADIGQLVKPGTPAVMARVSQLDPIYAYVSLDERSFIRMQASREERLKAGEGMPTVRLRLADGSLYPLAGTVDFLSPEQTSLGTFDLRLRFDNPDRELRPGQYAEISFASPVPDDYLVVPQEAVARRQTGDELKIVGDDGVVSTRKVELGQVFGEAWAIRSGVEEGEVVVVTGQFKAREGTRVTPRPVEPPEIPTEFLPGGSGSVPSAPTEPVEDEGDEQEQQP